MYNQITANKRKTVILIAIFFAVIWGIGALFGMYYGSPWQGIVPAIVISLVMTLVSYYSGDKIALATSGAKETSLEENPYLWRMVENLCIAQGMSMPRVYIMQDPSINAFATGRDPKHASIAVTTGAIQKLENEELEGVLAHELSHVKNYDILVMTIVIVLVGVIALLSSWFVRMNFWGGGHDRGNRNGNAVFLVVGLVLMIVAPIVAELIKLAVSRQREYLADASASLLTRYPDGLAHALEKIAEDHQATKGATQATAHLYFSNPFLGSRSRIANLFSTHPPIEDRIARLKGMA
ncbi:MAG: zinc metalloprotease HtpX [Candidatus Uhrbacteria bacterium]|nr:zinc metalloprotease HtpX [Candidatus Uhrbacteria bacterium]